jgi:hypothetical protein
MFTDSNKGLTQWAGSETNRKSAGPPLAPRSAIAEALGLEIRDSPISATDMKMRSTSSTKIVMIIAMSPAVGLAANIN